MSQSDKKIDPREFRNALGQFATGVTIVTTLDADRGRVGVTVSSFNSVSMDPPLVLWSLDKSSKSVAAFDQCQHFCVHVLAFDQQHLSNQFAKKSTDKFAGVSVQSGIGDVPVISDCAACFQCSTYHRYDGGDHIIFVGEVLRYRNTGKAPLVFHGGRYARARHIENSEFEQNSSVNFNTGSFSSDYFSYLISRAHFQIYEPLLTEVTAVGCSETDYLVLSTLCIRDGLALSDLREFLEHTGRTPSSDHIDSMARRGLVKIENDRARPIHITTEGRGIYLSVLSADKALEERALSGFSNDEIIELTDYMRRIIANTDPGVPDLWAERAEQEIAES